MKKVLSILLVLLLAGCGSSEKRQTAYIRAIETRPLDVPPHLDPPRTDTAITIALDARTLPKVSREPESTLPPLVLSSGQLEDSNVNIGYSAHGTYIDIEDTLDSSWRRVGLALPRMGMANIQSSKAERVYSFDYYHQRTVYRKSFWQRLKFWSDDRGPDYSGRYQVKLEAEGDRTRIYLLDANGRPVETTTAGVIFAAFLERLG